MLSVQITAQLCVVGAHEFATRECCIIARMQGISTIFITIVILVLLLLCYYASQCFEGFWSCKCSAPTIPQSWLIGHLVDSGLTKRDFCKIGCLLRNGKEEQLYIIVNSVVLFAWLRTVNVEVSFFCTEMAWLMCCCYTANGVSVRCIN